MKLYDTIASTLRPESYIILCSPIRTGSTLIYNILLDLFPHKTIKKTHSYQNAYRKLRIICTIRHPLDCIASTMKIRLKGMPPNEEYFRKAIREFDNSGIKEITKICDKPNTIIFKYEEFIVNLDPVYETMEKVFGRIITPDERSWLTQKHSIDSVLEKIKKLDNFSDFDPVSNLHGNHISDTKGKPSVYKTYFSTEQIDELSDHYRVVMDRFGYQ